MAQANSAQREPSMEEILASIRRIIEDSDNGRKPDEPANSRGAEAPAAQREVETFRSELGPVADESALRPAASPVVASVVAVAREPQPEVRAETAPKAFRLAEVQAQIARDAVAEQKPTETERKPITLGDVQRDLAKAPPPPQPAAVSPPPAPVAKAEPRPAEPRPEPKHEPVQVAPPAWAAAKATPPATVELRREETVPKPVAQPELAGKPVMISPVASRQIAASFNELSEAFAQRSKKTFDDMAEQMLRPMLQEWLDNNLPILVERLVREEIERVARGA